MMLFKEYLMVGGLPAAVASWIEKKSLETVGHIHYDLLATYRDDFSKYSGKLIFFTLFLPPAHANVMHRN